MQWHQLDYIQTICTSLQTENHTSAVSTQFVQVRCSSWRPTTVSKHRRHWSNTACRKLRYLALTFDQCFVTFKKVFPRRYRFFLQRFFYIYGNCYYCLVKRAVAVCKWYSEVDRLFRLLVDQRLGAGVWGCLQQHGQVLPGRLQGGAPRPQRCLPRHRLHQDESLQRSVNCLVIVS